MVTVKHRFGFTSCSSVWKGLSTCRMAFQLWIKDWKSAWKIKVSVANSEEEFKNTTVEELKRKVLSEDEYENYILVRYWSTLQKNRTLGFYGIKHEEDIFKVPRGTTYTVRSQVLSSDADWTEGKIENVDVSNSEEDFRNTTVKELKIKFNRRVGLVDPKYTLLYRGRDLEDDDTLGDHGIAHLDTLTVVFHVTAGGGGIPEDGGVYRIESMEKLGFNMQKCIIS